MGVMKEASNSTPPVETGTVNSDDGTTIGYYWLGQGPGLVLVHGAGQSSGNLRILARDMSDTFTVYVPDRRGRGMSRSYGDFHGLDTEIDDLNAVSSASGAHYVFGLSAGAVIVVEAARSLPAITKLALYEPPLSFNGVRHAEWVSSYERELGAGNLGGALVTVLKATADRRALIRYVPRSVLAVPLNLVIKATAQRASPVGAMSPRDLIPTMHWDAQTVMEAVGSLERFASLNCEILLLGGSKSARNLTASLDGLRKVLPDAKRVILQGVGHTAADNSRQPALVAAELRAFFA